MTEPDQLYAGIGRVGRLYHAAMHWTGYAWSVDYFVRELKLAVGPDVGRVLDAGCGTGPYVLSVLRHFPQVQITAFDYQQSLVEQAQKNVERTGLGKRVRLFTANVTGELPELQHEQFDVIIVSGVLEYVPMKATVKNLSRFLKPGGYFFHSPVRAGWYGALIGKLYRFKPRTQSEAIAAFTSQGYQLRRIVTLPPWLPASFKEAHIFRKV